MKELNGRNIFTFIKTDLLNDDELIMFRFNPDNNDEHGAFLCLDENEDYNKKGSVYYSLGEFPNSSDIFRKKNL